MIGVDFGGTNIKAARVLGGLIEASATIPTPTRPPGGNTTEAVLDAIVKVALEVEERPEAVGLAIPGEVNADGEIWRLPNVPGFEGFPIARALSQRLDCPVVVENDATTAALGEALYGAGRDLSDFLVITLGTGIGGGLVAGGQLFRGSRGFAAEIGHMFVESAVLDCGVAESVEDAWQCACGQRGCVEAYAGTRGLLRRYWELGGTAGNIQQIAESAFRGDDAALRTFQFLGEHLGLLLANIQNLLDLQAVIFSGGISASFALFSPALRQTLRKRVFAPPLGEVTLLVSQLGSNAGLVGAAALPEVIGPKPLARVFGKSRSPHHLHAHGVAGNSPRAEDEGVVLGSARTELPQ